MKTCPKCCMDRKRTKIEIIFWEWAQLFQVVCTTCLTCSKPAKTEQETIDYWESMVIRT